MDLKMEKTSWMWKDHGLRGCDYFFPMASDVFTIIILKYKKNYENHEYMSRWAVSMNDINGRMGRRCVQNTFIL